MFKVKNSANIMETTFCNPEDCPKEYTQDKTLAVFRNGKWVNILEHNKKTNKKYRHKKLKKYLAYYS